MDLGLGDRVVLITGAGGGAGPTVAARFAAEDALVALHPRGGSGSAARAEAAAAEIVAAGGRAMAVPADLVSSDEMGMTGILAVFAVWVASRAFTRAAA
jgi:NAD(P)-dependent dehydrogenase (short-subunit alcohol dehydrogenase family)